ncbi:uncharacterized protein LOC135324159 [Dromaius novaehollandiae]|uniref:uncharacterized protein LOC135324159 n=1 Tax=Dromaius novaehollandiae TaxID=8790 RepID=UPI00311DA23A
MAFLTYVGKIFLVLICLYVLWQTYHQNQDYTQGKNKRTLSIQATHGLEDNLILALVKGFATSLNESSITACLPMPKSVEDPLPMGILPTDIAGSLLRLWNTRGILEIVNPYSPDRRRVPVKFDQPFNFSTINRTNCTYYERGLNVTFTCNMIPWGTTDLQPWGRATNVLQYNQPINTTWCIQWNRGQDCPKREKPKSNCAWFGLDYRGFTPFEPGLSFAPVSNKSALWSCQNVINCSNWKQYGWVEYYWPVYITLKMGCLCRNHSIAYKSVSENFAPPNDCHVASGDAPAGLIWACSDGNMYTSLWAGLPDLQCTLGLPTLCPVWKRTPIRPHWISRMKRAKITLDGDVEGWQDPGVATRIAWGMEGFWGFGSATTRTRIWLSKLAYQVGKLANATEASIQLLNQQLQATSKMALQNRMALDLMMVHQNGLCGYLNLSSTDCCIYIPNVTLDLNDQLERIRQVAKDTRELQESMNSNWLSKIFSWFGLSVTGWIQSLIQYVIMFIAVVIIVSIAISCVKSTIIKTVNIRMVQLTNYAPLPKEEDEEGLIDVPKAEIAI